MSDKLLDYVLWHGTKWYVRRQISRAGRKVSRAGRKLAIAGVAGVVLIGGAAVLLRHGEDE